MPESVERITPTPLVVTTAASGGERMRTRFVTLIAVVAASVSSMGCSAHALAPGEGFVDVSGGRVWYQVVGSGPATPLLLLHGGPGVSSIYLKPLEALADDGRSSSTTSLAAASLIVQRTT